jgi:hypothetical protein
MERLRVETAVTDRSCHIFQWKYQNTFQPCIFIVRTAFKQSLISYNNEQGNLLYCPMNIINLLTR